MAVYSVSRRARADLLGIASYTRMRWGKAQARLYVEQLRFCAQRLADNPRLGRSCDGIRPGLMRVEQASHVVFFRRQPGSAVLVCRILHQRMNAATQPIDDDEP